MKYIEEIKKDLVSQIASSICRNCPHCLTALELIEQLERERDAAVKFLVQFGTDIPCDELNHSKFCEECTFSRPEVECWFRYFKEYGVQEVE